MNKLDSIYILLLVLWWVTTYLYIGLVFLTKEPRSIAAAKEALTDGKPAWKVALAIVLVWPVTTYFIIEDKILSIN